eukprot:3050579-Rhodomonas_salina.1
MIVLTLGVRDWTGVVALGYVRTDGGSAVRSRRVPAVGLVSTDRGSAWECGTEQEYLALDKRLREYQDQFELLGKQLA